jgi:hypothetical protein
MFAPVSITRYSLVARVEYPAIYNFYIEYILTS